MVTELICLGCAAAIILIFQLLPNQLIGLFIDSSVSPAVVEVGVQFLRIISPLYIIISYIISTGGLLRGTDRSMAFFIETILEFAVRIAMCFILTKAWNSYTGMMWAWYFGSSCGFIMCLALSIHTFRTRVDLRVALPKV